MDALFVPWRFAFVSESSGDPGCFFCAASADPDDPERLVVHLTTRFLVMLNRYPYTNGHLMVAPREHLSDPRVSGPEDHAAFWGLVLRTQEVLDRCYHPDGFNFGMNLGRAAGAGVPEHYHFHVVPRWSGDTNFASVVGGVRLIPEDLHSTREKLRALFAEEQEGA
jgi:ATP adenylyltransferase